MSIAELYQMPAGYMLQLIYFHVLSKGFEESTVMIPFESESRCQIGEKVGVRISNLDDEYFNLLSLSFQKIFGSRTRGQLMKLLKTTSREDCYIQYYGEETDPDLIWGVSIRADCVDINITIFGDDISITPLIMKESLKIEAFLDGMPGKDTILLPEYGIAGDLISLLKKTPKLFDYLLIDEEFSLDDVLLLNNEFVIPDYGLQYLHLPEEDQIFFLDMILSMYSDRINPQTYPLVKERWEGSGKNKSRIIFRGVYQEKNWSYLVYSQYLIGEFFSIVTPSKEVEITMILREVNRDFGGHFA